MLLTQHYIVWHNIILNINLSFTVTLHDNSLPLKSQFCLKRQELQIPSYLSPCKVVDVGHRRSDLWLISALFTSLRLTKYAFKMESVYLWEFLYLIVEAICMGAIITRIACPKPISDLLKWLQGMLQLSK